MKRAIIVGRSLTTTLLVRRVEQMISGLPHLDVLACVPEEAFYPHYHSLFGRLKTKQYKAISPTIDFDHSSVRSINVRLNHVTTEKGTYEYDYLIIDEQPSYDVLDLKNIRQELGTLLATTASGSREAGVTVLGQGLAEAQLALTIKRDALSHRQPRLLVSYQADLPKPVAEFILSQGVCAKIHQNLPGLTVASPRNSIPAQKVRGLKIGHNNEIQVDRFGVAIGSDVLVIPRHLANEQNTIASCGLIASHYTGNLLRQIQGAPLIGLPESETALFLVGPTASLVSIGSWKSARLRASIAQKVEELGWRKLDR